MIKAIYEVLREFELAPEKQDKMNILKFNRTLALDAVLQGAFHPNIQWVIKTAPSYIQAQVPMGMGYQNIHTELKRFYIFREGNPDVPSGLTREKKEQLFIQMLEGMEVPEAEVTVNMVLKDLKIKGLTYSFVKEVFPELLP